jgi:exodeoxyribonuclease VII small subunit
MAERKSTPKFEKDLEKLEHIVEALEEGELTLDESLKRFEEGIKIAQRCEKTLADAEKKIEKLTKNASGEVVAEPLDTDEKEGEETEGDNDEEGELLF